MERRKQIYNKTIVINLMLSHHAREARSTKVK